jgi:hypothetical protein
MAVEQTKSFIQQSLADMTDGWFDIMLRDASVDEGALPIKPHEAKKLLSEYLRKAEYFRHVGSSVQRGLLEALMITKTAGKMIPIPKFEVQKKKTKGGTTKNVVKVENKTWELTYSRIRAADFFPDPTGNGLYEIEIMYQDLHKVKAMAKEGIYDVELVNGLTTAQGEDTLHEHEKRRETNHSGVNHGRDHRPQVKIMEYWGDIVSAEGELLYENIVMTIANDQHVIRKPEPNPLWHQGSPYTVTPLIEVDGSVWHIALMDAPVKHHHAFTELFNLSMDAAFKHVHAPSQIRTHDLANPEQVADGIPPGAKLQVKSSLPPGAKVMEPLEETNVPADALNMLNMIQQEFNASALTNDLRQGVLPSRSVKATEVVEASQTITSVFQGMTKNIEAAHIVKEIELGWTTIAQNWDSIHKDVFIGLFGIERGSELYKLDPQDVFVQTVAGYKYRVFSITQTMAKAQDFQKITTALQTIGSSQILMEPFLQEFDPVKILNELLKALSIDTEKLKLPEDQGGAAAGPPQGGMPMPGGEAPAGPPPSAPGPGPLASIFGAGQASSGFNGGV